MMSELKWAVLCDSNGDRLESILLGLESSFFHFDSEELVTRPRVQAVAAVPCFAVYSDIQYILMVVI